MRGELTQEEIEAQLSCQHGNAHAKASHQRPSTGKLMTQRFGELNKLGDNSISFPEFVLCLRSWVFDDLEALSADA